MTVYTKSLFYRPKSSGVRIGKSPFMNDISISMVRKYFDRNIFSMTTNEAKIFKNLLNFCSVVLSW